MSQREQLRREFLRTLTAGAGLLAGVELLPSPLAELAGPPLLSAAPAKKATNPPANKFKTRHVVLVLMGGGTRTRDVFGTKINPKHEDCPNANLIASEGLLVRGVKTRDVGSYGSALSIFTGVEQANLKLDSRSAEPTVFELLRRNARLPGHQVWLSAAGADWHSNLTFSTSRQYGYRFAASYIAGDGVFTSELADITNQFGEPRVPDAAEKALLEQLQKQIDPTVAKSTAALRPSATPQDVQDRIRKYVLDELSGQVRKIESPGLKDIMALHYATNLLAVFKPQFLGVALIYAALGAANRDRYHLVLRKNDAELGRLWQTIKNDPELRDSTTLMLVPDHGRNTRENAKGGLDHDDKGRDHLEVFLAAAGPDFKKGELNVKMDTLDVVPTLLALMGVAWQPPAGKTAGRVVQELFA